MGSADDELYAAFYADTAPMVAQLGDRFLTLERSAEALVEEWKTALGLLHTIKGNCGMARATAGERLAHAMEKRAKQARGQAVERQVTMLGSLLSSAAALEQAISPEAEEPGSVDALVGDLGADPEHAPSDGSAARAAVAQAFALARSPHHVPHMRIDAEVLDRLLELVGECATRHRQVGTALGHLTARHGVGEDDVSATAEALELLGKQVVEIRQRVLDARLVPLQLVIGRFERLVRDLAAATDKQIALTATGGDTVVDKSIADQLGEPLMHILRNAVDHGIEPPEERRKAGKPERGRIDLEVSSAGGDLVVTLRDDGRGISAERIAATASRRGIDTSGWSERRIRELIFHPELSTADRITEISGRGVGMDQVKRAVERMGGDVELSSREGRGSEFRVRVPLAAAIRRTLVVECEGEQYAIPIDAVIETFRVDVADVYPLDRGWVTAWRGRTLSTRALARQMGAPRRGERASTQLCVVLEDDGRSVGVLVDRLADQQDVVVKELDPSLGKPRGIAGVAIVGEGEVAMVVDPRALVHMEARAEAAAGESP